MYYLIYFFYCKYLNIKKPALLYKKTQIFDKLLTLFSLLMLTFSEAVVCRCSIKQMFLKDWQKHKKHLCGSLVLIKLQVSRKRLRYRFSPVNFVKFKNTYFIEHPLAAAFAFWRSMAYWRYDHMCHILEAKIKRPNILKPKKLCKGKKCF